MVLFEEAFEIVKKSLARIRVESESVNVKDAIGRVIVEEQYSKIDLPGFDKSAMDGYAVVSGDTSDIFTVLETVGAGDVPTMPLKKGTATKVMTGAAVPEGAGRVVMIEDTCEEDGKMRIIAPGGKDNICRKGEDVRAGDKIFDTFTVLDPLKIANLISCGILEVTVARRIRVAIISTGNEIVDSPDELSAGKIMNSNGPLLEGLCVKNGFDVVSNSIVGDDLSLTVTSVGDALGKADIVLLSGGVSVGEFDFVAEAMERCGLKIHFDRVAIKPGKPLTFATGDKGIVFGLPGNPVAVYLMFHLFVLQAAKLMTGASECKRYIQLRLAKKFQRKKAKRQAFIPCKLNGEGALEQIEYHGSAHLLALTESDGFFVVPKDVAAIGAGEKVRFVSFMENFV